MTLLEESDREKLEESFALVVEELAEYFRILHASTRRRPSISTKLQDAKNTWDELEDHLDIISQGRIEEFQEFRKECKALWGKGASLGEAARECLEEYFEILIEINDERDDLERLQNGPITDWNPEVAGDPKFEKFLVNQIRLKGESQLPGLLKLDEKEDYAEQILEIVKFDWRSFRNCHHHVGKHDDEYDEKRKLLKKAIKEPGYFFLQDQDLIDKIIGIHATISQEFDLAKSRDIVQKMLDKKTKTAQHFNYNRRRVMDRLSQLPWGPKDYIDPDDSVVQQLIDDLEARHIVTITGEGGKGKTALANSYLDRNLKDQMSDLRNPEQPRRILPFETVVYLSTKDWPQGDFNPRDLVSEGVADNGWRLDPTTISRSAAYHVEVDLLFGRFIQDIVGLYGKRRGRTTKAQAKDILESNRILIILDNFEDIQDEAPEMAQEFFDLFRQLDLEKESSRIIITSRKSASGGQKGPHTIDIPGLEDKPRFDLIKSRMITLAERGICDFHPTCIEFFIEGEGDQSSFDAVIDRQGVNNYLTVNMRSPYVIFRFARDVMNAFVSGAEDIQDAVEYILANDEKPTFKEFIEETDKWAIEKSLSNYLKQKESTEYKILKAIYKDKRGLDAPSISEEIDETVDDVHNSCHKLNFENELIKWVKTGGRIVLNRKARSILKMDPDFENLDVDEGFAERKNVDDRLREKLVKVHDKIQQIKDNRRYITYREELPGLLKRCLDDDLRMEKRKEVNEENLILAHSILDELAAQIGAGVLYLDGELPEAIQEFDRSIINSTMKLLNEKDGGNRKENHIRTLVDFLGREGQDGSDTEIVPAPSEEDLRDVFWSMSEVLERNISKNYSWGAAIPKILKDKSLKPNESSSSEYWEGYISIVFKLEEEGLIHAKQMDLHLIVIDRILTLEIDSLDKDTKQKYEDFLVKINDNYQIPLDEERVILFDKMNVFNERKDWKGQMVTTLERFDLISFKEEDWGYLDIHFEYSISSTLDGIEVGKYIQSEKKRPSRWVVEGVHMGGSIALVSIPGHEMDVLEKDKEVIEAKVISWIEKELNRENAPSLYRLTELERKYNSDHGESLRSTLKGTGLNLEGILTKMVKVGLVMRINTNDHGGYLKLYSEDDNVEILRKLQLSADYTVKWYKRWNMPPKSDYIQGPLESLSRELSKHPHEDWREIQPHSVWLRVTLQRAIIAVSKQGRRSSKQNIRIDPSALFELKCKFIMERAREHPDVDDSLVKEILLELSTGLERAERVYSESRREKKAREEEILRKAKDAEEEKKRKKTLDVLKKGSAKAKKEIRKAQRKEEFGIISEPKGTFKRHINDYIAAIMKNPPDIEGFEGTLGSEYKKRTNGMDRGRWRGNPDNKRTDKFVWETFDRKRGSLDVASKSSAVSILASAVHKASGMSLEESVQLIKSNSE